MTKALEIQARIDKIKPLLDEAEDQYSFALASGDLKSIPQRKSEVAKYRNMIGALVKEKLKAMK